MCSPSPDPPADSSRVPRSSTDPETRPDNPGPRSRTPTTTIPPDRLASTVTVVPGACRSQLASRLVTTWASTVE
jgi:hypothetical protein